MKHGLAIIVIIWTIFTITALFQLILDLIEKDGIGLLGHSALLGFFLGIILYIKLEDKNE